MFSFKVNEFKAGWLRAQKAIGLPEPLFCVHQLRHRGASHGASEKRRQLLDIQRRGGWKHLDNLLRYEKRGRIQKSMDRLGEDTLAWCASSRRQLGQLVLGDSSRLPVSFAEALRK